MFQPRAHRCKDWAFFPQVMRRRTRVATRAAHPRLTDGLRESGSAHISIHQLLTLAGEPLVETL
eukprot:8386726-Pyramimonas_sp.AAC.1